MHEQIFDDDLYSTLWHTVIHAFGFGQAFASALGSACYADAVRVFVIFDVNNAKWRSFRIADDRCAGQSSLVTACALSHPADNCFFNNSDANACRCFF